MPDVCLHRFSPVPMLLAIIMLLCAGGVQGAEPAAVSTIRVEIKLHTGGGLDGVVIDSNDHGLVLVHDNSPHVFAWSELEPDSAYRVRFKSLQHVRSKQGGLLPEDHFQLGCFALRWGERNIAAREFGLAQRSDKKYGRLARDAVTAESARVESLGQHFELPPGLAKRSTHLDSTSHRGKPVAPYPPIPGVDPEAQEQIRRAYLQFGAEVQKVFGEAVTRVETDHFLIWTDWEVRYHNDLSQWLEGMYAAICRQLGVSPEANLFPARCPVFCWRTKQRFEQFAQHFDGYSGLNAVGYTRSIEKSGHVHLVLLRGGRRRSDFDRFACTLVHEGTHALLHRLYSSRLLPHWVNEGFADFMAASVLKERCPAQGNAQLLAEQFVRFHWGVGDLLRSTEPLKVQEYPIAHSLVRFLQQLGPASFAGFVQTLKSGESVELSLGRHYDGMTLDDLETQWRQAVKSQMKAASDIGELVEPSPNPSGSG